VAVEKGSGKTKETGFQALALNERIRLQALVQTVPTSSKLDFGHSA
jgi:hypothetical protein